MAEAGVRNWRAHRSTAGACRPPRSWGPGSGVGSRSTSTSRCLRQVSARAASRNLRQAAVTNQPLGSRGGSAGDSRTASTSAPEGIPADAKSAPRRMRMPITVGVRVRSSASSTARHSEMLWASARNGRPRAIRRSACRRARGCRQLARRLHRAVPRRHIDDVPPRDQVLGLDERPVRHPRRPCRCTARTRRRAPTPGNRRTCRFLQSGREVRMNCTCALTSSGVHWSIGANATAGAGPPRKPSSSRYLAIIGLPFSVYSPVLAALTEGRSCARVLDSRRDNSSADFTDSVCRSAR